jgi:hypothetical protein
MLTLQTNLNSQKKLRTIKEIFLPSFVPFAPVILGK